MYNRYIPQPDGSFQRSFVAEQAPAPPPPRPCPPESPPPKPHKPQSMSGFLRNLLPAGFDTADLIVVLLLLLLAGDQEEDRSTAMLTLVLYLFL